MNERYLCEQRSKAARLLTPGRTLRCEHRGCSVVVCGNGERLYTFDRAKAPLWQTPPRSVKVKQG
jgi:hypothetical protein